jgi:hypothetical protein
VTTGSELPSGEALRAAQAPDWLVQAVERLARKDGRSLEPYLETVGEEMALDDTQLTCRCHFIPMNPNGQVLVNDLIEMLVAQVVDYCIPRSRIIEAYAEFEQNGSTEQVTRLANEARGLFTKLKRSGEGGEMLLYLLLELVLGLPQLLCKMPLKTSSQMHVHGTDGIHGKVLPNGDLALYWCESKLYASVGDAIEECLKSLAPFLTDPGGEGAKRDVLLLRDHLDAADQRTTEALKRYFAAGTHERRRVQVRGAGLVGFSIEEYPPPFEADRTTVTKAAEAVMDSLHGGIGPKVRKHKLTAFEIELFCVPFPDVEQFRAELRRQLGLSA